MPSPTYSRNSLVQLRIPSFGIYPGQVIDVTHCGQVVHVRPILRMGETLKSSPHLGKTYIRSVEDTLNLFPLKTPEDYFNLGLDKYRQFDLGLESNKKRVSKIEQEREERLAEERRKLAVEEKRRRGISTMSMSTTPTGHKLQVVKSSEVPEENEVKLQNLEEREMRTIHMPLVFKKSELPVLRVGKSGGTTISIRENGQIGFSSEVAKAFEGYTACIIEWDDNRNMSFTPADPKKANKGSDGKVVKPEDLMPVALAKNGARYISAASILRHESVAYDYKVGTYSFDATIDEKTKKVSFHLPEKMDVKEKTPRKPRAKAASVNGAGSESNTTANVGEPELQPA